VVVKTNVDNPAVGSGLLDNTSIYSANAPRKLLIIDAWIVVRSVGAGSWTWQVRDAPDTGGTLFTQGSMTSTQNGQVARNSTLNTTPIPSGGTLVVTTVHSGGGFEVLHYDLYLLVMPVS
jgi:hypothetical protein